MTTHRDPNPTVITDPLFGRLRCTYSYEGIGEWWEGETELVLGGTAQRFILTVESWDTADVLAGRRVADEFPEGTREAYRALMAGWAAIAAQVPPALLAMHRECLAEIDYSHTTYTPTPVDDPALLLPECSNWRITLRRQNGPARKFTISCDCPWEDGHGFHAEFVDGTTTHAQ